MFSLIISAILGMFHLIPEAKFEIWNTIILWEFIAEAILFPIGLFIASLIKEKNRKHKNQSTNEEYCYQKPQVNEQVNPYPKYTVRWDAWNKNHNISSSWNNM